MKIQRTSPPPQKKKNIYIYKFSYVKFSISEMYKIYLYTYIFEDDKKDEIF